MLNLLLIEIAMRLVFFLVPVSQIKVRDPKIPTSSVEENRDRGYESRLKR